MFNIALVDIAGEFHKPITSSQWVIIIYLLTVTICLPLMGSLGDLKGKRNIHNLGLFIFMTGSLCCALSPNLYALIGFRVLQGIGASMYQATNMALVVSLFPPERRGRALGTVSTFVAAGALIGPSLGGVVVQWFSWRLNFWLLAIVALGVGLLAQRMIPKEISEGTSRLDLKGGLLFATAMSGLVGGLNMGSVLGWNSLAVWLLFLVFAVFAALFMAWCRSPKWDKSEGAPFIRLELFNHPYIVFGIIITVVTYMAAFTTQVVLPVYLRNVMHIGPAVAGLIVMGYPASLIFSAPLSGGGSDKFGSNPIIIAGLSCMTLSLLALSFVSSASGIAYVLIFIVTLGCSMGMISSPNNSIVMSKAPKKQMSMISSMIALNRNLGMMLGASAGAVVLSAEMKKGDTGSLSIPMFAWRFKELFLGLAILIFTFLLIFLWIVRRNERKKNLVPGSGQERGTAI
jgi:EmrB/QacA subfamily drug resistance transporter